MQNSVITCWKSAPALRIIVAQITGILTCWYSSFDLVNYISVFIFSFVILFIQTWLPLFRRFRSWYLSGISFFLLFSSLSAIVTWHANPLNNKNRYGINKSTKALSVIVRTESVEKPKTFKVEADITGRETGRIILYFKKDSLLDLPPPGSLLVIKKQPQEISNKGIPAGFDYKEFCLRKGITHQVFLGKNEFILIDSGFRNWFEHLLSRSRKFIIGILQDAIPDRRKSGLAEALLIGYKQDLDPELVKSYTNTGVVHIIAISGLHIGLIYWVLSFLAKPLQKNIHLNWLGTVLIIISLWCFSLLAGGQPSVLRSALMFSCIAAGNSLARRSSVFNSLAVSAIIQLAWNPFWLWDVGFQLSYSAVISIILFMNPVYNLLCFSNKLLDLVWKLNAVTISAQVLTFPVCIYYFHQFPNYFMLTNLVAVPLSTLILFSEIVLCAVSAFEPLTIVFGKMISWMIGLMNSYIEKISSLPNSVSQGLNISFPAMTIIYLLIFLTLLPYEKKD